MYLYIRFTNTSQSFFTFAAGKQAKAAKGTSTAVAHDHDGDGVADHSSASSAGKSGKTALTASQILFAIDTDGDGVSDGAEAIAHDHDGDGVSDHSGKSGKVVEPVAAAAPAAATPAAAAPAAVANNDMCSWIMSTVSGCPDKDLSQCFNGNTPYTTLAEAKTKCSELSTTCGAIMAHNDGQFYLRRASDPTRNDPGSKLLLFPCTAAAKKAFVDNNHALKTGAMMSAAVTPAAEASSSTMSMVTSLAIAFVAVGAVVGAARKFQSSKHSEYTAMNAVAITEITEAKPITSAN